MVIFLVLTTITIILIIFSFCPMFDSCRRRCREFHCLQQIYQQPHLLITQKKGNIDDYLFRLGLSVKFSMRIPVKMCGLSNLRCEKNHPFFPPYLYLKLFWNSHCLYTCNFMICLFNVQYSTMSVTFPFSSLFSNSFDSLKFVIISIFKQLVTFISIFHLVNLCFIFRIIISF